MMLRRFLVALPIEVALDESTGDPAQLRGRGRVYHVARIDEEWDVVYGWWAGTPLAAKRCYYRLWAVGGTHCLVYHEPATGQWFLAGIFD